MSELNKLSALKAKTADAGKYGDGGNLWLHKSSSTNGKWIFYFKVGSRRREMGLGPFPAVSLKEARSEADKWRAVVRTGADPIKERQREQRAAQRNMHLLKDIAVDAFESRKADLKDDGKAGRWFSPLELHVLPRLGDVPVAEINQIDIRDTLAPIWHQKADTCRKAMNRLGLCMKHAAALGLDVDLMAVEKAKALLGTQRHTAQHIPALPWQEVPAFYASLNEGTTTHLALRLLILTAVRSKAVRFMHVDQIDGTIWTVPAGIMKGGKGATTDLRVPLSHEAMTIIEEVRPMARDGHLFPSARKGVISDATMSRLMERRKLAARPHGFRSSFRDWVAETTNTPHGVAETAMGHVVGGAVERAYRRTDHFDQRKALMERWAMQIANEQTELVHLRA